VKHWEIIADNLKKAGWSLGWVLAYYLLEAAEQDAFARENPRLRVNKYEK